MTRSRASAKAAGTRFETSIVTYLAANYDDVIERRRQSGSRDRGDVSGFRFAGRRIVAEIKDCTRVSLGPWVNETELERTNDGAHVGLVIHKRHGKGDPGDQFVTMTVRDLVCLLTGERHE